MSRDLKQHLRRGALVLLLVLVCIANPPSYEAFLLARRQAVFARYFERERWHRMRFEQAAQCQSPTAAVLLGDSMTAGLRVDWPGSPAVVNMGIPGDFSSGVYLRLATVVTCRPRQAFIMIGINDILEGVPIGELQANHLNIVRMLHRHSPATQVYVQSVLPTFDWRGRLPSSSKMNEQVKMLNNFLKAQAQAEDFVFIDLYPLVTDGLDKLRPELTYDGIHLNHEGYALWYQQLKPYLDAQAGSWPP